MIACVIVSLILLILVILLKRTTAEARNNTLDQLPRTPAAAGLVGVALKRMKDMKNHHLKQYVNPVKIFRFLHKVKEANNPHFEGIICPEEYKALCKDVDENGYNLVYQDLAEDEELLEKFDACGDSVVNDEFLTPPQPDHSTKEKQTEKADHEEDAAISKTRYLMARCKVTDESILQGPEDTIHRFDACGDMNVKDAIDSQPDDHTNKSKDSPDGEDPLQKTQFVYDETVCMAPKYLEITVAPGEGQRPKSRMSDKHWDVKSFPQLHNPDGSNGKDQERAVKLTDQRYFVQRICNKETRFARCPSFLFASVGFLEEKHIYNSMSLAGTRGKNVQTPEGKVQCRLEDEYRVIESVPMSPKYWNKVKYEVLAKLDNFGPFQLFFTLSCADMRWDANFVTIMMERGYHLNMRMQTTAGHWSVIPEARTTHGDWKPIDKFIKEDVDESFHELICGNVVMATRYFDC